MPYLVNLADYDVNPERGFLPNPDPLTELPPYFAAWDALSADLPILLLTGRLRTAVAQLPILDTDQLTDDHQLNRAMMILSAVGSAYVWGGPEPALRLPPGLAVPWWRVAKRLDRPPITSHAALVLHNWRRLDEERPGKASLSDITPDNLALLQPFLGGLDESWFFLLTVAIEAAGAPALPALLAIQQGITAACPTSVMENLQLVAQTLDKMTGLLVRMPEQCDPYIFFHRVRPFVASWPEPGVVYEGVSEQPLLLAGGSAAQSSLLQAIDAGLGVAHEDERTRPFLLEMRRYMPPKHRRFIAAVAAGPALRPFIQAHRQSHPTLTDGYNLCLHKLADFRKLHLEISVRYILHQAPNEEAAKGTGGTTFVPFLSQARKETRAATIQ
jgi:indoleamine 2,3-dioxygenase